MNNEHGHTPTSPGDSTTDEESSRTIPTSPGGPTHSDTAAEAAEEHAFPTSPGDPSSDREPSRPVPTSPGSPTSPGGPGEPGEPTPGTSPIPQPYEPEPDPESPFEVDSARHRQVDDQEQRIAQERLNHTEPPR